MLSNIANEELGMNWIWISHGLEMYPNVILTLFLIPDTPDLSYFSKKKKLYCSNSLMILAGSHACEQQAVVLA